VVTAQFWLWIYNYNNGIANNVIGTVGLGPVSWLGNQDIVLYAVIFALMWQFSGSAFYLVPIEPFRQSCTKAPRSAARRPCPAPLSSPS